jgi:hypothetical protein
LQVSGGAGIVGNLFAGNINSTSITGTTITGTNLLGTILTTAQTSITSVGTLSSLTVSGAISSGAHTITGSGITAIINGGTTGVGNIGAVGAVFNTAFLKATTAQYADLAENYLVDNHYDAGTVVIFGGEQEITTTTLFADVSVAGVISTNPAYLMNSLLDGQPVALRGRVPVKIQGFVRKGDLLVTSSIPGIAISVGRDASYSIAVFAKALEDKITKEISTIEAVII